MEIEDPGNCAIRAFNDLGLEYIFISQTLLGFTRILTYGPLCVDLNELPTNVNCNYSRKEYNASKVQKAIREFLNQPGAHITQAEEVTVDEALNDCKSLIEYMKQTTLF